jgi:hypothetical protein
VSESADATSKLPSQPSIQEEDEAGKDDGEEAAPVLASESEEPVPASISPPLVAVSNEPPEEMVQSPTEVTTPTTKANFPVKSVQSLKMQFQDSEPPPQQQQQKVLVEPTHRRMGSDQLQKMSTSDSRDTCISPPRSASGGSKISMLAENFNKKAAATAPTGHPPPIRPRPPPTSTHPAAPLSPAETPVFPLMQHPGASGGAGVSPLQRVAHESKHKPALGKKPTQPVKPPPKGKAASKLKKKDSLKEKDKGSKPVVSQKPPGFAATPAEIQAQLQAARAKRKQSDDKL